MNFVFREELAELGVKLGGESLVVGENEGWAIVFFDDICHRESLARAGHAKQSLLAVARRQATIKLLNRLRLVAGRLVLTMQLEIHFFIITKPLLFRVGEPCAGYGRARVAAARDDGPARRRCSPAKE